MKLFAFISNQVVINTKEYYCLIYLSSCFSFPYFNPFVIVKREENIFFKSMKLFCLCIQSSCDKHEGVLLFDLSFKLLFLPVFQSICDGWRKMSYFYISIKLFSFVSNQINTKEFHCLICLSSCLSFPYFNPFVIAKREERIFIYP